MMLRGKVTLFNKVKTMAVLSKTEIERLAELEKMASTWSGGNHSTDIILHARALSSNIAQCKNGEIDFPKVVEYYEQIEAMIHSHGGVVV